MKMVKLASGLVLPAAELATKVTGNFGIRGSGKSNTMALVIEQLLDANIQVIVLDPVGIHFAIRLQPDGRTPSRYQIPILGGPHGDVDLQPTAGEIVGRALALSNDSCVLDISRMSRSARIKFSAAFAETFFESKKENPAPTLLALEEAQFFMPQQIFKGEGQERMLGAFEELGEQGRNHGAGILANTLRPQALNKVITSLMDLVVCYRLTDVAARKRVREWVQEKDAAGRDEIDTELPGLPTGHAFVWGPAAFDKPIYGKYHFHRKTTYDAGATPLAARAKVKLKALDLDDLKNQMAAVVEQGKANDPRALKAKIVELERELAKKPNAPQPIQIRVERSILKPNDLAHLERLIEKLNTAENGFSEKVLQNATALAGTQKTVVVALNEIAHTLRKVHEPEALPSRVGTSVTGGTVTTVRTERFVDPGRGPRQAVPRYTKRDDAPGLSRCARAILGVLAVRGHASDSQLSALSGYRKTSSGFANALSELRTQGLIDDGSPERRGITEAGRAAAGPQESLPTGRALLDYWMGKLSRAEATMLNVIYDRGTVDRAELSNHSGYSQTSSGFANAISGLRTLDLVTGPNGGDLTIAEVFKEG